MKSIFKLRGWSSVSVWLSCVFCAAAQPAIQIAPAGSQSVLYYADSPANYILQSTTNLASTNWVTAADSILVAAATVSNVSPAKFYRLLEASPPAGMVLIPAGSFTIGNSIGDTDTTNADPAIVYVSAFYMDVNLVSLELWQSVLSFATSTGYSFIHDGAGKAADHPVQTVSWFDCVKWCNARSEQEGLTPVYYTNVERTLVFHIGDTNTPVYPNWAANGYRLPTEAEWEKAARGGSHGLRFPWGNLISGSQANYTGATNIYAYDRGPDGTNALGLIGGNPPTSPIGSFDVNGYGLYDMAGNVFQWCWDWYGTAPFQPGSPYLGGTDPHGPVTGIRRIERGGCFGFGAAGSTRCAFRNFFNPVNISDTIGFRCVRGI